MAVHFHFDPMEGTDAVKLLLAFSLKQLRERFVWANAFFDREDTAQYYIARLVKDLYEMGYRLQSGEIEVRAIGRDVATEQVYLWKRLEDTEYGLSSSEQRLSLDDVIVSETDHIELIAQAVIIRKAHRVGFDKRSAEVQTAFSGLLGVDLSRLADED